MTNDNHNGPKLEGAAAVACSDLLGRRLMGRKSCDDSAGAKLRAINNMNAELAEMLNYPGPMAVLIESLKRKGVRLDELNFRDGDITHKNQYVTVIGGDAAECLHRIYDGLERGLTAEQVMQDARLYLSRNNLSGNSPAPNLRNHISHNRSLPNVQSSATATGGGLALGMMMFKFHVSS
jgi:hypothetical protein